MNDTCPLYNPNGACKCRICKPVYSIDMDKEYAMVQRMMRLADLYGKFEKELPRKKLLGEIPAVSCHKLLWLFH